MFILLLRDVANEEQGLNLLDVVGVWRSFFQSWLSLPILGTYDPMGTNRKSVENEQHVLDRNYEMPSIF